MVTKLEKNVVMPMSSPAFSRSGFAAAYPADATNPARMRSLAVSTVPEAFQLRGDVVLAHQRPEQAG